MLDSRALENPRPSLNKKRLTIAALLVVMSIAWANTPLAGIIYFAIHARHYMVLSPEEEFAMNQRERPKETAV